MGIFGFDSSLKFTVVSLNLLILVNPILNTPHNLLKDKLELPKKKYDFPTSIKHQPRLIRMRSFWQLYRHPQSLSILESQSSLDLPDNKVFDELNPME